MVNNSWSGSRVTKFPSREGLFPSGCSDERTSGLHVNAVMPDVIIVYLGTNDWAYGVTSELCDVLLDDYINYSSFCYAYEMMLSKLKKNYPKSEIWCCTLNETFIEKKPSFVFPHTHAGVHIEVYNEIIRRVVQESNCRLIDLYKYKMPYDSIDGSHPTAKGMNTLATMVIRTISNNADIYPFVHATAVVADSSVSEEENDIENSMMAELYGSPEMFREKPDSLKDRKITIDFGKTVQFCRSCGKDIPISAVVCPYCGINTRTVSAQEAPMACVYASPKMMRKMTYKKKIESFFGKFFRRKKKQ